MPSLGSLTTMTDANSSALKMTAQTDVDHTWRVRWACDPKQNSGRVRSPRCLKTTPQQCQAASSQDRAEVALPQKYHNIAGGSLMIVTYPYAGLNDGVETF